MKPVRAVIYCRCSTDEESQLDALQNQVFESKACVKAQGWFLAGEYVESKSGTTTKGRLEYNRLFEDLQTDKFDVIVIKSQDRLMRNVKDWYLFLDRMQRNGKRLFMYIEKKFYTTDDALITGIKAILAEEYSRELSKKINNAHRRRQVHGGKAMINSRVFGFQRLPEGGVGIVEEEAQVIRRMYQYCISGYGTRTIANILINENCHTRQGIDFTASAVRRMLRNPLYKGEFAMNKKHFDCETKRVIQNPKEEWILAKGIVPPIVDEETWQEANDALARRAARYNRNGIYRRGDSAGKYDLSGKLVCGQCGGTYYRVSRKAYGSREKEKTVVEWKCRNYLELGRTSDQTRYAVRKVPREAEGGCDNVHLDEEMLFSLLEQISCYYYKISRKEKKRIIDRAVRILNRCLEGNKKETSFEALTTEEERISQQKELLLTKLLDGIISDGDYGKRNRALEEKLEQLRQEKERIRQQLWERKNLEDRIALIRRRLEEGGVERATVAQMLKDIRQITVYEWHIEVSFDPFKIMQLSGDSMEALLNTGMENQGFVLAAPVAFSPETARGRYLDQLRIMELIKTDPALTAKKIASNMERSVYMVRSRMVELEERGCLAFCGAGGHGYWKVLRQLEDVRPVKEIQLLQAGKDMKSYKNGDSGKGLTPIGNQIPQSRPGRQKLPDDHSHQAQPDIHLHIADH